MEEIKVHPSWQRFFTEERTKQYIDIISKIGDDFTPDQENILRFMRIDLNNVLVCIVGQDPYFSLSDNLKVANGRAFQPNDLKYWHQKHHQASLRNILRLVHKNYNNIIAYEDIYKYTDIVSDIDNGKFKILEPPMWFDSLERQGVMFLNRSLTTKIGLANAHTNLWNDFVKDCVKYMDLNNPNIYYYLWGNSAKELKELIINGHYLLSNHPMMCSNKKEMDFLKCDCFLKTKDIINWLG